MFRFTFSLNTQPVRWTYRLNAKCELYFNQMGLYDQIRFFRIPYAEIAAEVGVTETYVCAVLRGRRNNRFVTKAAQEALTRRKQALREALSKEPDHD